MAYVGITRAKEQLYLTRAILRASWGSPVTNPASRFLAEVPEDLIHWRRLEPERSYSSDAWGTPSPARSRSQSRTRRGGTGATVHKNLNLAVGDR
ncbi:hypothetical protein PCS98_20030, partial [Acinetobacter baumannii]